MFGRPRALGTYPAGLRDNARPQRPSETARRLNMHRRTQRILAKRAPRPAGLFVATFSLRLPRPLSHGIQSVRPDATVRRAA